MSTNRRLLQITSIVVILTTMLSSFSLPSASAQEGGDGLKREVNAETGKISFISSENAPSLLADRVNNGKPRSDDPAMDLARQYAPEFGVQDPERELTEARAQKSDDGRVTVKYQQKYDGIPIMGGELIVNTNDYGDLYSMNGEVSPNLSLSTQPEIDSNRAQETALQAVAKWHQATPNDFVVSDPELWIFDESLLQPSDRPVELVWRMEVTSRDNILPVRELVLVNAHRGGISLHFNQIDNVWGEVQPEKLEVVAPKIETPKINPSSIETIKDPMPQLSGSTWYVATTGDDSNNCATISTPCATINAAIGKAATSGDAIYVSEGTYTGNGFQVVLITKSVTVLGGWNANFSAQSGYSTIDAGYLRRGVVINVGTLGAVNIDRFVIKDGYASNADLSGEGGGGINIQYYSKLILTNSLIYGNKAGEGGGIFSSAADLTIINTTISSNYATEGGGAILFLNYGSNNTLTIKNSTLSHNIAATGGGIYIYDSGSIGAGGETISNTIIALNTSADAPDCKTTGGGINSADHNMIMNESGCTMPAGSNSAMDPIMTPTLVGNPGHHALFSNSPAIDAGGNDCPTTDQRGLSRPQGSACDIGAYEYPTAVPSGIASLAVIKGNNQKTLPSSSFPFALSVGLIDINGDLVQQNGVQITLTAPNTGPSLVFADTGSPTSTITTNQYGVATSSLMTANSESGSYSVSVTSNGLPSIDINVQNALWYVATTGNDTNACDRPSVPCATINAVLSKPNFSDNDTIKVAEGTYTGTALINKGAYVTGGWNSGFNTQVGFSTIDGGGISTYGSSLTIFVSIDRFIVKRSQTGIYNTAQLTLSNSSIHSNSHGGITNFGPSLDLYNVVISNNTNSGSEGGGILTGKSAIKMNNVTISDNHGYSGGGIYYSPYYGTGTISVLIANTIISGNTATTSAPNCNGPITSLGHNIIGNMNGCTITSGVGDQLNVNPKLGVFLQELGYHPLLPTSPAINAGNGCYGTTDQRGVERVGICDIGAFEYVTPGPATSIMIVDGNNQTIAPNSLFANPLRAIALDDLGNPVEGVPITFTAPANGPSVFFSSNNSKVATYVTDVGGVATTSTMKANNQLGSYFVEASALGVGTSINFTLENLAWYVAPTGLDSNSCKSPDFPCATINGALAKMADGDKIYVAVGVYTNDNYQVVFINKSVSLSGGWDLTFTNQTGLSVIDGQNVRKGITVSSGTNSSLEKFIIRNGKGEEDGGGIYNGGALTLYNTAITNNNAVFGGGIRNSGTLILNNTTIIGNTSSSHGGGIYNDGGALTLNNTTISNNSTRLRGGGIFNPFSSAAKNVKIRNSIISNNTVAALQSSYGPDCAEHITSLGHNIIGSIAGCTVVAVGGDKFNVNPKLGTFLPSLGYQPLLVGSPAINSGDNATCLTKDQRGLSRISVCDIGAYEYKTPGSPAIVSPLTADLRVAPNFPAKDNLKAAVLDASGSPVGGGIIVTFISPDVGPSILFANGTHATSGTTNSNGIASSSTFTTNNELGKYTVAASIVGGDMDAELTLENFALFVSTSGDDSNDCKSVLTACKNIQTAINTAVDGDTVYVAEGIYTEQHQFNTSSMIIDKNITIIGGMDETFSSYHQPSIIDGEMIYGGIANIANATLSRFIIRNTQTGVENIGSVVLQEVSIVGNTIGVSNSAGELEIRNTTISNNRFGVVNDEGNIVINNSTITNNVDTASNGQGGGIRNVNGKVVIKNSILANNYAVLGPDCYNYNSTNNPPGTAVLISAGNNIIGSTLNCDIKSNVGDKFNADPLLLQLLPIGYQPIQSTSPAKNNGDPTTCTQSDQRGIDRLANGKCDIGAYEYTILGTAISFGYLSGSNQQAHFGQSFANPFVVYVVDSQGSPVSGIKVVFTAPSAGASGIFANTKTNTATMQTDISGLATAPTFIADSQEGSYNINATVNGLSGSASFALTNKPLSPPKISTYTAKNSSSLPGTLLCNQTSPGCPSGDNIAKKAHQYALGVYDLYTTKHLRDSLNDKGMVIKSTVHYKSNYANAFWNGKQLVYGDAYGFPLADDIVAHEYTHGVTQYESNLFPFYQSGAISESLSDLWGEYYDQTNGLGNDTAAVKWLLGEDVTGLGAVRSMKNPIQFGDPDKMSSPNYIKDITDNGGIHHNSGVNNKAVYLMVDGGTFNGKTVIKLGWDKTAAIYYEANTNLLTSGSDYSDLYFALQQACSNLIGQKGITSADCVQVKNALLAVEMNGQPASNFNPEATFCPNGLSTGDAFNLYKDDFENGEIKWIKTNTVWTVEDWYATSPIHMFYGDDSPKSNDSSLAMKTRVSLPAGSKTFLHFKHAFLFDYVLYQGQKYYFDGGVLEYSLNGTTWLDTKPLFSAGQDYKGVIYNYSSSTNKLKGRSAFVGDSHGYVSSLYDLSSLAGKKVQFRWRLATDQSVSFLGWFVDDVQIYTCIGKPSKPVLSSPANNALVTDYTPDLDWSDSTPAPVTYQIQIADNNAFSSPAYSQKDLPDSNFTVPTDLAPNTKYYWRVRAINALNKPGAWSTTFTFRTVMVPPVLLTPTEGETLATLQPLLDWEDAAGATKYVLQVSDTADFSNKLVDLNNLTESTYQISSDLPTGATIYWRVRALGPNGPSGWSPTFSFVTP